MAGPIPSQSASRTSTGALSQQPTLVGGITPPRHATGTALTRAITQFRNKLTGSELTEFSTTTYDQLCKALIQVQHEQEHRMEAMNLARVKSCLEAMHQFGQVIEIFLNVSDAVAFVWGPMKFILLTASTFADSFEQLLDAYERIGEQLPLLVEYESLFHKSPHMIEALEKMYLDILEFHRQALKFFSGRCKRTFLDVCARFN
ncbi:hypothetical protein J4E80_009171 [Alternaria sp. BMP 0032]|nr:hypothetical protein J4E80_009171 [Alternaria sp. BMP 0032]